MTAQASLKVAISYSNCSLLIKGHGKPLFEVIWLIIYVNGTSKRSGMGRGRPGIITVHDGSSNYNNNNHSSLSLSSVYYLIAIVVKHLY